MTTSQQVRLVRRVEGLLLPLIEELRLEGKGGSSAGQGLLELGIKVSIADRRRQLPADINKLYAWCSPAQRDLLSLVTEMTGVLLDEHITLDDAELLLQVLRNPEAAQDDAPL